MDWLIPLTPFTKKELIAKNSHLPPVPVLFCPDEEEVISRRLSMIRHIPTIPAAPVSSFQKITEKETGIRNDSWNIETE